MTIMLRVVSLYEISVSNSGNVLLLPTGSEEMGVLGVGSIPLAICPSSQFMKLLHHDYIIG